MVLNTKLAVYVWTRDNGDGSPSPVFFPTRELAEYQAQLWEERGLTRYCDDISCEILEIDSDGFIVPPNYLYDENE